MSERNPLGCRHRTPYDPKTGKGTVIWYPDGRFACLKCGFSLDREQIELEKLAEFDPSGAEVGAVAGLIARRRKRNGHRNNTPLVPHEPPDAWRADAEGSIGSMCPLGPVPDAAAIRDAIRNKREAYPRIAASPFDRASREEFHRRALARSEEEEARARMKPPA